MTNEELEKFPSFWQAIKKLSRIPNRKPGRSKFPLSKNGKVVRSCLVTMRDAETGRVFSNGNENELNYAVPQPGFSLQL